MTGTFTTSDGGILETFDITTTIGIIPDPVYNSATTGSILGAPTSSSFDVTDGSGDDLHLFFASSLTSNNAPGPIGIVTDNVSYDDDPSRRSVTSGQVTGVVTDAPEPMSVLILGSALAGMGLTRRRG